MASLGREINLNPPLTLGQLPDTSEELMKLDQVFIKSPDTRHDTTDTRHDTPDKTHQSLIIRHQTPATEEAGSCVVIKTSETSHKELIVIKLGQVFIKSELKVGVIYVKEGQYTEEEILDNNDHRSKNKFKKFKKIKK